MTYVARFSFCTMHNYLSHPVRRWNVRDLFEHGLIWINNIKEATKLLELFHDS